MTPATKAKQLQRKRKVRIEASATKRVTRQKAATEAIDSDAKIVNETVAEESMLEECKDKARFDVEEEEVLQPKFHSRQRIFAKDLDSGLLYQGIIRRASFGIQYQRQVKLSSIITEEELKALVEQDPEPSWWYFIHYSGWNVKWDRWVQEEHVYESTEATIQFAKRLQNELKTIKSELRNKGKSGKNVASRVASELERRMALLEREHRIEERRRELAEEGKLLEKSEEDAIVEASQDKSRTNKWSKANIEKELTLRQRHLQGKRSQNSAELLTLPITLKKLLVEDWELITQSDMLAVLPAAVTIRQALEMYRNSKLGIDLSSSPMSTALKPMSPSPISASKQEIDLRDMIDGICLFFDQALPERLLYHQEQIQCEIMFDKTNGMRVNPRRFSEVYGCEFLLRLFLRLPSILVGDLPESAVKSILSKIQDLVRYLHKNQTDLFSQKYRRWNDNELLLKEDYGMN
jgi:mortality factor 4-like protein 1